MFFNFLLTAQGWSIFLYYCPPASQVNSHPDFLKFYYSPLISFTQLMTSLNKITNLSNILKLNQSNIFNTFFSIIQGNNCKHCCLEYWAFDQNFTPWRPFFQITVLLFLATANSDLNSSKFSLNSCISFKTLSLKVSIQVCRDSTMKMIF